MVNNFFLLLLKIVPNISSEGSMKVKNLMYFHVDDM